MASHVEVQSMSSPAEQLRDLWDQADPWDYDPAEIAEAQMTALREIFDERRGQLSVLDQRARDERIDHIRTLQDAVPLLFSHTTYKSYPASFLEKKRWDMMTRWLGTLSTHDTSNVKLAGIESVDDWWKALADAGHFVISSSGTTGHSSFVNQSQRDRDIHQKCIIKSGEVVVGRTMKDARPLFRGGPAFGTNMGSEQTRLLRDAYVRNGEEYYISEDGITIKELNRLASIRKAVIDGTATPGLIADAENEADQRSREMESLIQSWVGKILDRREEPMYLFAGPAMLWRIMEIGRERGIPDGTFNKETMIRTGGGMKGFRGPANFREEAAKFFGIPHKKWVHIYGMTELSTQFLQCDHGRFHVSPTVMLLLLDKAGEKILNQPSGIVEGRGGFFDIGLEGRWGGVISGDRLTVDFDPCPCGRKSASVMSVTRYQDLPEGDDKLTCAGQIDTYVRGFIGGDWQS